MRPIPIAVAVVEQGECVLIGPRGADVPLAGLWEFPGGKIRPGESPSAAAARECREETGLLVEVRQAYPVVEHVYEPPPGAAGQSASFAVRLHFFACRPCEPDALPAEPFRWVPLGELRDYEFPSANAPLVAELVRRAQTC